MELRELLKLTEKEVESLPLLEQMLYWQHKYHAVCTTLATLISSSKSVCYVEHMTIEEVAERYGTILTTEEYNKLQDGKS